MRWTTQSAPESRPVVDWLAGQIHDPVAKLRFLKIAANHGRPDARKRSGLRRYLLLGVVCLPAAVLLVHAMGRGQTPPPRVLRAVIPPAAPSRPAGEPPPIWQVEKTPDYEVYSNGLRIETRYTTSTHHRRYVAFAAGSPAREPSALRDAPAGIVFHATESRQAPFEESENRQLKRFGESALEYVRRKGAYNFVIDRFGRVYRVVEESDAANHAGYSLWADDRWIYINLNESFLGVSFEAGAATGEQAVISPAQQRAAAVLVEMLRGRYRIAPENCITHAQVSVNPDNMRVGYHTDWAAGFPFEAIGLPNNYTRPLSAVAHFGFVCDPVFLEQADHHLRSGIQSAEDLLRRSGSVRAQLQREYRAKLALVRRIAAGVSPAVPELASAIK